MPRIGEPCDDGDLCTAGDACDATGRCVPGPRGDAGGDPCSVCTCDPETGISCTSLPVGSSCDDGDCCTTGDTCQPCNPRSSAPCPVSALSCQGQPKGCDDRHPCTSDACRCVGDEAVCEHSPAPDGTPCTAHVNLCTTGDACVAGQCLPGEPRPLDDGNPCTQDSCVKGRAWHEPLSGDPCDDGDECTLDDRCSLGTCVGGEPVVCAEPACAASVSCVPGAGCVADWLPEGVACDDGDPCTDSDVCTSKHVCEGERLDCDDANPCTDDACQPGGVCLHSPNESSCDDGDPCTELDFCSGGTCMGGEPSTACGCANAPTLNCTQKNELDPAGKCCCWIPDPTGKHRSAHVLDYERVYTGGQIECCIRPGWSNSCRDTNVIDVSEDGAKWTNVWSLKTTNGHQNYCDTIHIEVPFRFLRAANDSCYVDFIECSYPCEEPEPIEPD